MTPEDRLRAAEVERALLHRLEPSQPLKDAADAAAFVAERRIVTETGHAGVPVLAHTIAGRELVGSWMAAPEVHRIYDLLNEVADHDLCFAPLLDGKVTIFDPALAPAVVRIASDPGRRAALVAQLPPPAAKLLRRVESEGDVRMDSFLRHVDEGGSEREARKWFDFAAERIDLLVDAGRIERVAPAPRQRWLLPTGATAGSRPAGARRRRP